MASASSSRQGTPASREGSAVPSVPAPTDLYRPLATAVSKPLAPLLTSSDTSLPTVLELDASTYNARLSGKTVMLTDIPGSSSATSLVSGRKKNRGDETLRAAAREAQAKKEAERVTLGRRKRKHLAVTSPETRIDYASLVPVHYLHVRYMAQLCNLPPVGTPVATSARGPSLLPGVSPEALQSKLVKADLTGAKLVVRAARNASLVGISGLVIEETAGSIRLVGTDSRVRVIPKVGTQFTLRFPAFSAVAEPGAEPDMAGFIATCPQIEIDILGTAFAYRSGDRAGRKFRPAQGGGGGSGWGDDYVQAEWSDVLKQVHDGEDLRMVANKRRKRGKSRRKDPLVQGSLQVF